MNPTQLENHLSEEAINDLLTGACSSESTEHLAGCELCRDRVAEFRATLDRFNQAALAWSEAKAVRPLPRPERRPARLRPLGWSAATAAFLLAAGAAWNYRLILTPQSLQQHVQPHATTPGSDFADSPDQIAEDNQLLRNVYNALEDQPQSPVNEFSIPGGPGSPETPAEVRTQ